MEAKIRIYLADDHQVLIDGMFAVLKTNPLRRRIQQASRTNARLHG